MNAFRLNRKFLVAPLVAVALAGVGWFILTALLTQQRHPSVDVGGWTGFFAGMLAAYLVVSWAIEQPELGRPGMVTFFAVGAWVLYALAFTTDIACSWSSPADRLAVLSTGVLPLLLVVKCVRRCARGSRLSDGVRVPPESPLDRGCGSSD